MITSTNGGAVVTYDLIFPVHVADLIDQIRENGYSDSGVERSLCLTPRTIKKWHLYGASHEARALLWMIVRFPWLLNYWPEKPLKSFKE